jgi:hypothetical protein
MSKTAISGRGPSNAEIVPFHVLPDVDVARELRRQAVNRFTDGETSGSSPSAPPIVRECRRQAISRVVREELTSL